MPDAGGGRRRRWFSALQGLEAGVAAVESARDRCWRGRFGFPRLPAHGMWMKARCLELEDRLPDRFAAWVEFKRPLLLPATVTLATAARDGGWLIALQDAEEGKPRSRSTIPPSTGSNAAR